MRFDFLLSNVFFQVSQNASVGVDDSDSDSEAPSVARPQMSISVTSRDILEMTFTKTSLEVFKNLGQVAS